MKEILTVLVASALFVLMVVMCTVIMPPVEKVIGHNLPWWFKVFITSVVQGLLGSVLLFAVLGFVGTSGGYLIHHHPISFVVTAGVGTILFIAVNLKSGEFR